MSSRPRRTPPPRRGRPPARPQGWQWLLVGPGVLTVGVAVALLLAWRVDSGAQTAAEAAASASEGQLGHSSGRVPSSTDATAYSITYRITEPDAPLQIERKIIQRPFLGSDITYNAKGGVTSGAVTAADGAYIFLPSPQPHWGLLESGNYRATGDDHPGAGLALAVQHHLARVLGTRQILGRTCTVVRTGSPVGSAQGVTAPTAANYTDICVDNATGQALDELWILDGKLARERRASAFDANPTITADSFHVDSTGPAVPEGTSGSTDVVALQPADIAKLPVFMAAPEGFSLSGVQDQVTLEQAPGSSQPSESSTIYAHFVSGSDLIDLEEGALSTPTASTYPVHLADGRSATLTVDLVSSYLNMTVNQTPVRLEGPDVTALLQAALLVKGQGSSQ